MKKILLSLFVGLIGLINFGYCSDVSDLVQYINSFDGTISNNAYHVIKEINNNSDKGTYCLKILSFNGADNSYIGFGVNLSLVTNLSYRIYSSYAGQYICMYSDLKYIYLHPVDGDISISYELFKLNSLLNTQLPVMTSLECQTEYNLIPVSSVDQNYCVNNGFCSSGGGDCSVCPGSGDNWSALYINDIQHLGKPIINITFPDYLDWDYTINENEFNLDIVGYPVDTEYIDGIIRTQNYKPTSEDFTQLVGMLAPYSKYLLFLLFIFIIWAWIKKPFKSKKL